MPIRLDLLAAARDEEKMRHRNPVKRAYWIAGFAVGIVLVWMLKLGFDIYSAQSEYRTIEKWSDEVRAHYTAATNSMQGIGQADQKLDALNRLATNRFFWAPVLSALERSTVDGIRVTRFSGVQTFTESAPGAARSSSKPGAKGGTLGSITLRIQAVDSTSGGHAFNDYQKSLNNCDYFSSNLKGGDGFVLGDILRHPVTGAPDQASRLTTFVLVAHFPEVLRDE